MLNNVLMGLVLVLAGLNISVRFVFMQESLHTKKLLHRYEFSISCLGIFTIKLVGSLCKNLSTRGNYCIYLCISYLGILIIKLIGSLNKVCKA